MHAKLETLRHASQQVASIPDLIRLGLCCAKVFPVLLRPQVRQRLADRRDTLLLVALGRLRVGSLPQRGKVYAAGTIWHDWLGRVIVRRLVP